MCCSSAWAPGRCHCALLSPKIWKSPRSPVPDWCKRHCRGPTPSLFPPLSTVLSSRFLADRRSPTRRNSKAKLGVNRYGATSDFAVRLALRKWGLNPERNVNILQIGTTQDTVRAMQSKMLDAGVLSGTASLIARKAGFRELADLADLGLHYPMAPIGTTKTYIQKNEDLVREFMLAYIEAIHDFKRNKEAALAVLKKYTRNEDREVLEDSYNSYANKYLALPIPTLEGIRTILTELSTTVPAAKNADPEQFVSSKIAREIEASGFVKRLYEK